KERGILNDRKPWPYLLKLALNIAVVGACCAWLPHTTSLATQLLISGVVAFFLVQCVIIAHDAMHRQLFHDAWKNDLVSLLVWNVIVGISHNWFVSYHNKHH